jgi:hypothetical protein
MESKSLDTKSFTNTRSKALEQSFRAIGIEELMSLTENLIKGPRHRWSEFLRWFIQENADSSVFYYATTDYGIQVIYTRAKEAGIWYVPGVGAELMRTDALKAMKEFVDAR